MKRFYVILRFYFSRCKQLAFVLPLLVSVALPARAQTTFFEDFEDVPLGELPDGWTWYQDGGTNPTSHWEAFKYPGFGTRFITSGSEVGTGDDDADWVITPPITVAPGDELFFDGSQDSWTDFGSRYYVRVSTTTNSPAAFTDVLATYYEESDNPDEVFPKFWAQLRLSLAAYEGQTIYIAFVHISNYVPEEESQERGDSFGLDNVWVRPLQAASLHQAIVDFEFPQPMTVERARLLPFMYNNIRVIGDYGSLRVNSFTFTQHGTLDPKYIKEAKLYYTGSTTLLQVEDETSYTLFGTLTEVDGTFVFEGDQEIQIGSNYFWLAYTLDPAYVPSYPYPEVAVNFDKISIDGVEHTPEIQTLGGIRSIVPTVPLNDNFANAIPITSMSARYGSSNVMAFPEPEIETLSYCSPNGRDDGTNSVWWHFKAPATGWITADLSASKFNTILTFYDSRYEQIACNDDINVAEGIVQSKIADFPVFKGDDIYIRVTGLGDGFSGPANADAGVIELDFTFSSPLGVEEEAAGHKLSDPYPNPAKAEVSFDVTVSTPGTIILNVSDMMGGTRLSKAYVINTTGTQQRITLDVSALPQGTYIVSVEDSEKSSTRKLVITR